MTAKITRATTRLMKVGDLYSDHKLGPCLVVAARTGRPFNTVVIERVPAGWNIHDHFATKEHAKMTAPELTKLIETQEELQARAAAAIRHIEAMEARRAKEYAVHMAAIKALIAAVDALNKPPKVIWELDPRKETLK